MLLNTDLDVRTVVDAGSVAWVPSPASGVERRMLYRIGDEKARATSIVRYAAGSHFARHTHTGGEEFLVLDGTFQDDLGEYPAGSYVRNPPGSSHAPGTAAGCTIFVKLWQFAADDSARVVRLPGAGVLGPPRPGVAASRVLFDGASERVLLEDWEPGADITLANPDGLELLVVAGGFIDAAGPDRLGVQGWLRLPARHALRARAPGQGARVWYKSGPLQHANVCPLDARLAH